MAETLRVANLWRVERERPVLGVGTNECAEVDQTGIPSHQEEIGARVMLEIEGDSTAQLLELPLDESLARSLLVAVFGTRAFASNDREVQSYVTVRTVRFRRGQVPRSEGIGSAPC